MIQHLLLSDLIVKVKCNPWFHCCAAHMNLSFSRSYSSIAAQTSLVLRRPNDTLAACSAVSVVVTHALSEVLITSPKRSSLRVLCIQNVKYFIYIFFSTLSAGCSSTVLRKNIFRITLIPGSWIDRLI